MQQSLFDTENLVIRSAEVSACGKYRYSLCRAWPEGDGRKACFIMLNPSTADALLDDPTIRRCAGFAKRWGMSSLVVVNLFALRATDPKDLFAVYYRQQFVRPDGTIGYHDGDPIGTDNNQHILDAASEASVVIAAWGVHGVMLLRDDQVKRMLTERGVKLQCLRLTKDGYPRHPLYLKSDAELIPFAR